MSVKRIFVEKKEGFNIPAQRVLSDINHVLKIPAEKVRLFLMYDIEGIPKESFAFAVNNVFSEPPCDTVYENKLPWMMGYKVFAVEYLRGQYDQRADSAEQCVELLLGGGRPKVATANVYAVKNVSDGELEAIQQYLVNPTDSKLSELTFPETLQYSYQDNDGIEYVEEFIDMHFTGLKRFHAAGGFAMSLADMQFVQTYFREKRKNPTVTELKVIDTYWSDHCRHTTFLTELQNIGFGNNKALHKTYDLYRRLFKDLYKDRPEKYVCLMDIATIATKALKKQGLIDNLDESDEINACSIKVTAKVDDTEEEWLVMFKNETHNHPTEIEPFGGAATCLGGAIRDPLSGRVYVYQAMRITGAGDIFKDVKDTLPGKLPQRVISKTAAHGFSSYGNQIGLATGIVNEIYHDGYVAKRLETGFVIGAAPAENVRRAKPEKGDQVILLGGETGRDGCGGATGSSKAHNKDSVIACGAEVQKGNPLTERKIQRFFRDKNATVLIKKCNDFGAGGVAVAIGELADGLDIYLDRVPKKYRGLSVTETAISESQERMAVVVAAQDVEEFLAYVRNENLDATVVAEVTDFGRMRMFNKGETVVDLERSFLDTNGVKQAADVFCRDFKEDGLFETYPQEVKDALAQKEGISAICETLKDKNVMLQKGQSEMFDSTIGAGSVFMPFGGKYQLTPALCMAAKLPVRSGYTDTVSVASWAFNPKITDENPFFGGLYATLTSVAKLVAAGISYKGIRLTLQEFFKRLNGDKYRFGEPFAALLGALSTQYHLGIPAIGGKDSMSGSYEELDVPNTLISFAVGVSDAKMLISNVFERGSRLYRIPISDTLMPDFSKVKRLFQRIEKEIRSGNVSAATVVESGGAVAAIIKSAAGNKLGIRFKRLRKVHFEARMGDFIIAAKDITGFMRFQPEYIADITDDNCIEYEKFGEPTPKQAGNQDYLDPFMLLQEEEVEENKQLPVEEAIALLSGFEPVYPVHKEAPGAAVNVFGSRTYDRRVRAASVAKPRVLIPVFPGTNCEYDTARRFEKEGAETEIFVIKNTSPGDIAESAAALAKAVSNSQIIAFPGGFSGGDEPDGSGKFIAATFRNPQIAEAVMRLINKRDGLILGICNGFQALIKLGLLPYGKIEELQNDSPTLTFNAINRHISNIVKIRIASNASPWLHTFRPGEVFDVPVSHGEGRFAATEEELKKIIRNSQIATQYVDLSGNATMETPFNPNGSLYAIEGLLSADGRILGKMGHSERWQENLYQNVPGRFDMNIFRNGVEYFK